LIHQSIRQIQESRAHSLDKRNRLSGETDPTLLIALARKMKSRVIQAGCRFGQ